MRVGREGQLRKEDFDDRDIQTSSSLPITVRDSIEHDCIRLNHEVLLKKAYALQSQRMRGRSPQVESDDRVIVRLL